VINFDLRYCY